MQKRLLTILILTLLLPVFSSSAYAFGGREAAASLILPTTGQAMNGELGKTKTKIMAGLEFGLVSMVTILGVTSTGGTVLLAATPLVANHVWSSIDAYKGARRKAEKLPSLEIAPYQGDGIESGNDIRQRIQRAGAQGN